MAFKRIAGASGVMNKPLFLREVLGEGVPVKLAEVKSSAFNLSLQLPGSSFLTLLTTC